MSFIYFSKLCAQTPWPKKIRGKYGLFKSGYNWQVILTICNFNIFCVAAVVQLFKRKVFLQTVLVRLLTQNYRHCFTVCFNTSLKKAQHLLVPVLVATFITIIKLKNHMSGHCFILQLCPEDDR